jgi:hypothetical protein
MMVVNLECSRRIFENYSSIKFNEIHLVKAGVSMRTDGRKAGQTKHDEAISLVFRNFANVPKHAGTCTSEVGCTYSNCRGSERFIFIFMFYFVLSFSFFVVLVIGAVLTLRSPFFLDVAPCQWMIAIGRFKTI